MSRIVVVNARNPPWFDRGTHLFSAETFLGSNVVSRGDQRFENASREPQSIAIDVSATIDRVRLTVQSNHLSGGGFSEVKIE